DPKTLNMDLVDAARKLELLRSGRLDGIVRAGNREIEAAGIIAVHVGGLMMDIDALTSFAGRNGLWVIEDAAHAFPAAWRPSTSDPWRQCGEGTADVSCFSFYANKTITTGEGGMAVTNDEELSHRMRMMSLHGLSHDAWNRYSNGGSWDYKIAAPGFKYNLTDIAAAIGIHQLARAEAMREAREEKARQYQSRLASIEQIELPPDDPNRVHSWHLFPVKLNLDSISIDRNQFVEELKKRGVGCSVHWRPLHLHPYYERTFGWQPTDLPFATEVWTRLVSLPLFPQMTEREIDHVVSSVAKICSAYAR